jgi:hypothetical protein
VPRQGDDRSVEGPVGVVLGQHVAVALGGAHPVEPALDLGELLLARGHGPGIDRAHRVLLQRQPDAEQLLDVAVAELGDPRAPARHVLDQTLLREQPEGLAQRSSADVEPQPDLVLDQPLARLELAGQDLVTQLSDGDFRPGSARGVRR